MTAFPNLFHQRRVLGLTLVALSGLVQAVAAGFAAFSTRDMFTALSAGSPVAASDLAVLFISGAAIAVMRILSRVIGEFVGQHFLGELRDVMFRHLSKVPPRALKDRRTGDTSLRFVGDLSPVQLWASMGIAPLISAMFAVPGALITLWCLNGSLALIGLVAVGATFGLMTLFQTRLARLNRRLRRMRARIASDVSERIPVAAELRLQGRVNQEAAHFTRRGLDLRKAALSHALAAGKLRTISDIAMTCAGIGFFMVAFSAKLSGAEVATGLGMLAILAISLAQLSDVWDRYRAWLVARDKCCRLLDIPTQAAEHRPKHSGEAHGLALNGVFADGLCNVSAIAHQGDKVVVIGPSDAAKSTLLSLIAGFESPQSGEVSIYGLMLDRRDLCYVGPRSPILKGSILRALTMGMSYRPSNQTVLEAAERYGFSAVLDRLGGLEGRLSEGGRNLSSSEIRRLQLIRASLSQPKILLLDEPDDAHNPDERNLVTSLMAETQATTICVTDDLALARAADQVWMISNRQLVATGEPASLMSESGPVQDFVRLRDAA